MNYCDHFSSLVLPKVVSDTKYACSDCKTLNPFVWVCLSKGCGYFACQNNKFKHMYEHEQQSKKKNHCIWINPVNAEIKCIACKIQIYDFQDLTPEEFKKYHTYTDPFLLRRKYLPHLIQNDLFQKNAQLENSTAHKKSNKGLCGLFKRRNNSAINSIIQYFSNIPYYKSILKHVKLDSNKSELKKFIMTFSDLIKRIWSGENKCIGSNDFSNLIFQNLPKFKGYQRKDTFELFSLILNNLHEEFKFFERSDLTKGFSDQPIEDQWKIITNNTKNSYKQYSAITNPLISEIKYYYQCKSCKEIYNFTSEIMGIKLEIPKKKRIEKEIQIEYSKRKYISPDKRRGKSLFDRILGVNQQLPITILQLLFNFINTIEPNSQRLKLCKKCGGKMEKVDIQYSKLPKILFFHIPRMNKDGYTINSKHIQFSKDTLQMRGFVSQDYKHNTTYEFASAICITKQNDYITIAKNFKSKQIYQFCNENIKLNLQNYPPYLICYILKNKNNTLYHNIKSNISIKIAPDISLPEFWLQQLKYFQPGPLINQKICKHNKLKPKVQSKVEKTNQIPIEIYQALVDKFGGRYFQNQECESCLKQLLSLSKRKKIEKQFVSRLDNLRCNSNCMISCVWLKKWTEFLYKKKQYNYFIKNTPVPGPINNCSLLENNSNCKMNLKKGEDFKIINIYVWIFFKQLYGGGPQIQYKTKVSEQSKQVINQEILNEITTKINQLKQYLTQSFYTNLQISESPVKTSSNKSSSTGSSDLFNKSIYGDN